MFSSKIFCVAEGGDGVLFTKIIVKFIVHRAGLDLYRADRSSTCSDTDQNAIILNQY